MKLRRTLLVLGITLIVSAIVRAGDDVPTVRRQAAAASRVPHHSTTVLQVDRTKPQASSFRAAIRTCRRPRRTYLSPAALGGYLTAERMKSKIMPDHVGWPAKR